MTQAYLEVRYRTVTSSTVYAGGAYEKQSDGSVTKYYAAGGAKVVRQVPPGGGAGTLSWLLADHLGTTVGALDGAGSLVAAQRYWPYGAVRSVGVTQTDKLYTGQQAEPGDAALGLYNYRARFYSTVVGRFVSSDSVPDGLNRYTYVRSQPTRLTDPTGRCFQSINGEELDCSGDAAASWFACAMGGCRTAPRLERYAKQGISQWLFWSNVLLSENRGQTSLSMLRSFVVYASEDATRWHQMPSLGWRYFAGTAHVPEAYFKASLFALMFGDTSRIAQLELGGVAGGYAWWDRNDLAWGLGTPVRAMFNADRRSGATRATFARTIEVAALQSNLSDSGIAWHEDQRVVIAHTLGITPPDLWGGDSGWDRHWDLVLRCNFLGLGCSAGPLAEPPFVDPFDVESPW